MIRLSRMLMRLEGRDGMFTVEGNDCEYVDFDGPDESSSLVSD